MTDRSDKGKFSRRAFLGTVAGLSASVGLAGGGWATSVQNESSVKADLELARTQLTKVLQKNWVAYGGGTNIKFLPDPVTKEPTVPSQEVWHFDLNFAYCRIDNNPEAFLMPTYSLGEVLIDANSFSMVMLSKQVGVNGFTVTPEGAAKLRLTGQVGCATAASSAGVKIGSRVAEESASFEIVAVDDDVAGDSFAFTVFFQPTTAPVNNAIFGPKATFTGQVKNGGVTIRPIQRLPIIGEKAPPF